MKPKLIWPLSLSNNRGWSSLASLIVIAGFVSSCGPQEEPEPISPVPDIEIVSLNKTQLEAQNDTLRIALSYIDGDGDIGDNARDKHNLFVQDSRLDSAQAFRVHQLAPDSEEISIQGTLTIELDNITLIGEAQSETFTLDLHLVDRAGNSSDTVRTEEITIAR